MREVNYASLLAQTEAASRIEKEQRDALLAQGCQQVMPDTFVIEGCSAARITSGGYIFPGVKTARWSKATRLLTL